MILFIFTMFRPNTIFPALSTILCLFLEKELEECHAQLPEPEPEPEPEPRSKPPRPESKPEKEPSPELFRTVFKSDKNLKKRSVTQYTSNIKSKWDKLGKPKQFNWYWDQREEIKKKKIEQQREPKDQFTTFSKMARYFNNDLAQRYYTILEKRYSDIYKIKRNAHVLTNREKQ